MEKFLPSLKIILNIKFTNNRLFNLNLEEFSILNEKSFFTNVSINQTINKTQVGTEEINQSINSYFVKNLKKKFGEDFEILYNYYKEFFIDIDISSKDKHSRQKYVKQTMDYMFNLIIVSLVNPKKKEYINFKQQLFNKILNETEINGMLLTVKLFFIIYTFSALTLSCILFEDNNVEESNKKDKEKNYESYSESSEEHENQKLNLECDSELEPEIIMEELFPSKMNLNEVPKLSNIDNVTYILKKHNKQFDFQILLKKVLLEILTKLSEKIKNKIDGLIILLNKLFLSKEVFDIFFTIIEKNILYVIGCVNENNLDSICDIDKKNNNESNPFDIVNEMMKIEFSQNELDLILQCLIDLNFHLTLFSIVDSCN